jgi:hypothetical protein
MCASLFGCLSGVFAGAGGGGEGESLFGVVVPAGAGVAPAPNDQSGVVVGVGEEVGLERGEVEWSPAFSCFGDEHAGTAPGSAERREGNGVPARLGREVTAETEHVHPLAEQQVIVGADVSGLTIVREGRAFVAYLRYRDYSGRGRRIKRSGRSRAEASREVLKAVKQALGADGDDEFTARNTLNEAAKGWLAMFAGQVERGARSPSTYDAYRDVIRRVIEPGVGSLRLGEVTTPRLDRFVQAVLVDRGYATAKLTRSVLSGVCGWLVRRGALPNNPVRDLTPLELDRDRTARALSLEEVRQWLRVLDANPAAQHHDLPELARFMLATGLRLGEALGVTWVDLDLIAGTVAVYRTIIRVQGKGLIAKRVKSKASERGLIMPAWCEDEK